MLAQRRTILNSPPQIHGGYRGDDKTFQVRYALHRRLEVEDHRSVFQHMRSL